MFHQRTSDACKGKWKGILETLGVPPEALTGRHAKCPLCTSRDNFRWDNQDGTGSYICTCGSGHGMKLAIEFTGEPFETLAPRIDAIVGNVKPDGPARPKMSEDDRRTMMLAAWKASRPVEPGDLVDTYLTSRGLGERIYPTALRFAPKLRDGDGGVRPCMVAMVGVPGHVDENGRQKFVSMHRTFLRPDGKAKAEMPAPRKLMPGVIPQGACVMLSDWTRSGPIGIAEGIETAMAASRLFTMPVWASINTAIMQNWLPPEGAEEIVIFADHDWNAAGHAAAYALLHKLRTHRQWKDVPSSVQFPKAENTDWNDELRTAA